MKCMCGDSACPSCGTAQGTYQDDSTEPEKDIACTEAATERPWHRSGFRVNDSENRDSPGSIARFQSAEDAKCAVRLFNRWPLYIAVVKAAMAVVASGVLCDSGYCGDKCECDELREALDALERGEMGEGGKG